MKKTPLSFELKGFGFQWCIQMSFMDLIDASAKTLIFQGVSGFFDCFFGISEVFRSCLLIFEQKWI